LVICQGRRKKQMLECRCKALDSAYKRRGRRKVVKRKKDQQKRCCLHSRSTGWQIERL